MNESENSFSPRVIQLNHFIIVRKKGKFIVDNKNLSTKIFALQRKEYFNQEIEKVEGEGRGTKKSEPKPIQRHYLIS